MRGFITTAILLAAIAACLVELEEAAYSAPLSSCEVIHRVFDPAEGNGAAACRVAQCESGLSPWAVNGSLDDPAHAYLGLFQLGAWARASFLRGAWFSKWENAKAALRLYRSNRHSWLGQWSCGYAAYR